MTSNLHPNTNSVTTCPPRLILILSVLLLSAFMVVFWNFLSTQFGFAVTNPGDWGHTLLVPLVVAGVNLGVRFPASQTPEFMALRREMKQAVSDFFLGMARYTSGPDAGSFPIEPCLFRCIKAHERLGDYLERGGYIDRAIMEEDECARVALIYHAYHRVAIRRVRLIRRLLVVRFEESRRVNSQKVARTA